MYEVYLHKSEENKYRMSVFFTKGWNMVASERKQSNKIKKALYNVIEKQLSCS